MTAVVGDMQEKMLRKVRGLLAKAENPAATEEEAAAYTEAADRLMLKYALDVALVAEGSTDRGKPEIRVRPYPAPHGKPKTSLLTVVAAHYGCEVVRYGRRVGRKVEYELRLYGFPTDLDMVELLATSLLVQGTHASVDAGRHRASFWWGYAHRVDTRLAALRAEVIADAAPGAAVVLADRTAEVRSLMPATVAKAAPPRPDAAAFSMGVEAAERADLNQHKVGGQRFKALT